jgi:hypothetical protein
MSSQEDIFKCNFNYLADELCFLKQSGMNDTTIPTPPRMAITNTLQP